MRKVIIALLFPLIALPAFAQEDDDWDDETPATTTAPKKEEKKSSSDAEKKSTPAEKSTSKKEESFDDEDDSSSSSNSDNHERQSVVKYPKLKTNKKKKIAAQLVEQGSYYNAVEYYEDVIKAKPDDVKTIHALAELNRALRDYQSAEKYYDLEIKKVGDKWPNDYFFLGQMQKMNGNYEQAKKTFQQYQKVQLEKGDISYKSLSKIEIQGCDSVEAWSKNPLKIKVQHQDGVINNIQTDYAPHPISGGRLLYASLKSDTAIMVKGPDAKGGDYYSKLYIATREGKEWKSDKKLPAPPNSDTAHVGNGVFSADEKTMYYTQCTFPTPAKSHCNLYRIAKDGDNWGKPEALNQLNDQEATTTQPAIGLDKTGKEVLYFVSDRAGKGGMDIFYAEIQSGGKFGQVKNAGQEINTPGDEWTPYYDKTTKSLYFSSNGFASLGGLDVFNAKGAPGAWGVPHNMGAPINSSADDIYFVLNQSGSKGFIVSNRIGTKTLRGETSGDDIWEVIVNEDVVLKSIFVDRKDSTKTPIEDVEASLYKVKDGNFDFVATQNTTAQPLFYTVKRGENFKINGNKDGYWPSVENVSISEDDSKDTIAQIFYMDKIEKAKIKIENIYFAFDKSNVLDYYKLKLDSVFGVLVSYPTYNVEIQGHTDSKGSDAYNQKLSQKRAEEAKEYLVKKGIVDTRIIAVGLGETQPIAPNQDNGQDDPEGRARNRRVEFKILTDKPEAAGDIEYDPSAPIDEVKTGPGFTKKKEKPSEKK